MILDDPLVIIAVILRVAIIPIREDVLADGYHVRSLAEKSFLGRIWHSEELHLILVTMLEFPVVLWGTRYATDFIVATTPLTKIVTIPVLDLRLTTFGVVLGLLFTLRWAIPWYRTIKHMNVTRRASQLRTLGFPASVMFGIGFGVVLYVAVHPNETIVRSLFGQQLVIASQLLESFQAGLGLGLVDATVNYLIPIFINNITLAAGAGVVAVGGGVLIGAGLLPLVVSFSALMIPWGVFTGILVRQTIIVQKSILGPPAAILASFGAGPLGHAFHEFMGIALVGVGGYFIGLGFITGDLRSVSVTGGVVGVIGGAYVFAAAVLEVGISPPVKQFLIGYLTVETSLPTLTLNSGSTVGVGSAVGWTLVVFVPFTALLIRTTINVIEANT